MDFRKLLWDYQFIEAKNPKERRNGGRNAWAKLSFHCLRSTAVTALRLAGVPADLCRVIVGHDSEEIERVYFRPDSGAIAEAMKHLSL